jgi:hypothetical protein
MPQPVSSPITSTPSVDGQPYDATSEATIGPWVSVDDRSGPASLQGGQVTGDFPSTAPWQQV